MKINYICTDSTKRCLYATVEMRRLKNRNLWHSSVTWLCYFWVISRYRNTQDFTLPCVCRESVSSSVIVRLEDKPHLREEFLLSLLTIRFQWRAEGFQSAHLMLRNFISAVRWGYSRQGQSLLFTQSLVFGQVFNPRHFEGPLIDVGWGTSASLSTNIV